MTSRKHRYGYYHSLGNAYLGDSTMLTRECRSASNLLALVTVFWAADLSPAYADPITATADTPFSTTLTFTNVGSDPARILVYKFNCYSLRAHGKRHCV